MTLLSGAPDFQAQTAQSLRFVGNFAVNVLISQSFDLSDLVTPNDQAILVFWQASAASTGFNLNVLVTSNLPQNFFTGASVIADQGQALFPFPGQLVTGPINSGLSLVVGADGPPFVITTGDVFVFAVTSNVYTTPVIRRALIGIGNTANGNVLAGATTAILGPPTIGTYFRIKHLSAFTLAAPAAAARVSFLNTLTAGILLSAPFAAAVNQSINEPLDVQWDQGISVTNNTSVTVTTAIVYERWQS